MKTTHLPRQARDTDTTRWNPRPFSQVLGEDTHRLLQGFARHGFAIFHKVREAWGKTVPLLSFPYVCPEPVYINGSKRPFLLTVRRFVKRHVSIETDRLSRLAWDKRKEDLLLFQRRSRTYLQWVASSRSSLSYASTCRSPRRWWRGMGMKVITGTRDDDDLIVIIIIIIIIIVIIIMIIHDDV
jgi:hypothetical protein